MARNRPLSAMVTAIGHRARTRRRPGSSPLIPPSRALRTLVDQAPVFGRALFRQMIALTGRGTYARSASAGPRAFRNRLVPSTIMLAAVARRRAAAGSTPTAGPAAAVQVCRQRRTSARAGKERGGGCRPS